MKVTVHNLSKLPTAPIADFKELQSDFKTAGTDQMDKLKKAIMERGFKYPFFAWQDKTGQKWCVDAHRRKQALDELENEGNEIPAVPYVLITAKDKTEAVEEIAYLNSRYGEINPETSLFSDYDIDLAGLDIEIPEINLSAKIGELNEMEEWEKGKMPEYEQPDKEIKVIVYFKTEEDREKYCKEKQIKITTKKSNQWISRT